MSAEEVLLNFMGRPGYKPMRLEAIVTALGGGREDLMRLRKTMPRMLKTGAVITVKGHLLALPAARASAPGTAPSPARKPEADLLEGTILFRPSGSARVVFDAIPGSPTREQLHIDSDDTHVALHGDRVLVKLNANRRDRNGDDWGTGTVVRVVKRALTQLTGTLGNNRLQWFVVPDDPRVSREIIVRDPARAGLVPAPKPGDKVVARLDAAAEAELRGELRGHQDEMAHERGVFGGEVGERRDRLLRDHEHVGRGLRRHVVKRQAAIVFVFDPRGNLAVDDFREDGFGHYAFSRPNALRSTWSDFWPCSAATITLRRTSLVLTRSMFTPSSASGLKSRSATPAPSSPPRARSP
jgi:hypothetical protein